MAVVPSVSARAVDIAAVLHGGRELEVHQAVELPDFGSYRFEAPAQLDLTLRSAGGALEVSGRIAATALAECSRCVEPMRVPVELDVNERIVPDEAGTDPLAEANVLQGDRLDVADLARQLIDSALPLAPLCSEDCSGLCPTCGQTRDGACRCA